MRYAAISAGLLLAACSQAQAPSPPEKPVGLANPASVYCVEQGGKVEIRKGPDGEAGYCHLPDGRVIDEWEFFRASQAKPGA